MKTFMLLVLSLLSMSVLADSKTIAQCTVDQVKGYEGVRVNLLKADNGELKANLIFGTTASGTMYHVQEVSPGTFLGSIKNKPQYTLKLMISLHGKTNAYVNGTIAYLEAVYPTLQNATGRKMIRTTPKEKFVCGKIISPF